MIKGLTPANNPPPKRPNVATLLSAVPTYPGTPALLEGPTRPPKPLKLTSDTKTLSLASFSNLPTTSFPKILSNPPFEFIAAIESKRDRPHSPV